MGGNIDIHGLVSVSFRGECSWKEEWIRSFRDVLAIAERHVCHGARIPELVVVCEPSLPLAKARKLAEGIYVERGALVDRKYGVRLEVPDRHRLLLRAKGPCLEWLAWGMQLALLGSGAAFVHGACLENNGRAFLFPSWGGVGKTALVASLLRETDWRMLGDDLVILSRDGTSFGFPKPLVLYPYHRRLFPGVFSEGRGPVAPRFANAGLTRAMTLLKPLLRKFPTLLQFARAHNPQSVRLQPSSVFGDARLCSDAKLGVAVWLERVRGLEEPEIRETKGLGSRIMGSTLLEYDPWCVRLTNVAIGLGLLNAQDVYGVWLEVLERGLASCKQYVLDLPLDLPLASVSTVVKESLSGEGLI